MKLEQHVFGLLCILYLASIKVQSSKEIYIIRYLENGQIIPVAVELDPDDQTEYISSPDSGGKSVTFYDFLQRKVAYKDLNSSQCFVADLSRETLEKDRKRLKLLNKGVVRGFFLPTFIIQGEINNRTDLTRKLGNRVVEFCDGNAVSFVLREGSWHGRRKRDISDAHSNRKKRDTSVTGNGEKGQFTHHSYGHYGHQSNNYAHYGHETYITGKVDKDGNIRDQRLSQQQVRSEGSQAQPVSRGQHGEPSRRTDTRLQNGGLQGRSLVDQNSFGSSLNGRDFGSGGAGQFSLQTAQESGYQLNLPLGLRAGNAYRGGIRTSGQYGVGGIHPQMTTDFQRYPGTVTPGYPSPLPPGSYQPGLQLPDHRQLLPSGPGLAPHGIGRPGIQQPDISRPLPSRQDSFPPGRQLPDHRQLLPSGPGLAPHAADRPGIQQPDISRPLPSRQDSFQPDGYQPVQQPRQLPSSLGPSLPSTRGPGFPQQSISQPLRPDLPYTRTPGIAVGQPGVPVGHIPSTETATSVDRSAVPSFIDQQTGKLIPDSRIPAHTALPHLPSGAQIGMPGQIRPDTHLRPTPESRGFKMPDAQLQTGTIPGYPGLLQAHPGLRIPGFTTSGQPITDRRKFPGGQIIQPSDHVSGRPTIASQPGIAPQFPGVAMPGFQPGLPIPGYTMPGMPDGHPGLMLPHTGYPGGYPTSTGQRVPPSRDQMGLDGYFPSSFPGDPSRFPTVERPGVIPPGEPHISPRLTPPGVSVPTQVAQPGYTISGVPSAQDGGFRLPGDIQTPVQETVFRGDITDPQRHGIRTFAPSGEVLAGERGIVPGRIVQPVDGGARVPGYEEGSIPSGEQRPGGYVPYSEASRRISYGERHEIGESIVGSLGKPPLLGGDDSASSQTQVQTGFEGTAAEASSAGRYRGHGSQTQVQGGYSGNGSFSAQAQSGFTGGVTQSQVQGGKQGGISGSSAQVEKLGSAQSQVQVGQPSGAASSSAQGRFSSGSTQVQAQSSRTGGSAGAQAQSRGLSNSQVQVNIGGEEGQQRNGFHGSVSASVHGGLTSGQAQTQLQGGYDSGRTYVATGQGGFDSLSGFEGSVPPVGSLPSFPLRTVDRDIVSVPGAITGRGGTELTYMTSRPGEPGAITDTRGRDITVDTGIYRPGTESTGGISSPQPGTSLASGVPVSQRGIVSTPGMPGFSPGVVTGASPGVPGFQPRSISETGVPIPGSGTRFIPGMPQTHPGAVTIPGIPSYLEGGLLPSTDGALHISRTPGLPPRSQPEAHISGIPLPGQQTLIPPSGFTQYPPEVYPDARGFPPSSIPGVRDTHLPPFTKPGFSLHPSQIPGLVQPDATRPGEFPGQILPGYISRDQRVLMPSGFSPGSLQPSGIQQPAIRQPDARQIPTTGYFPGTALSGSPTTQYRPGLPPPPGFYPGSLIPGYAPGLLSPSTVGIAQPGSHQLPSPGIFPPGYPIQPPSIPSHFPQSYIPSLPPSHLPGRIFPEPSVPSTVHPSLQRPDITPGQVPSMRPSTRPGLDESQVSPPKPRVPGRALPAPASPVSATSSSPVQPPGVLEPDYTDEGSCCEALRNLKRRCCDKTGKKQNGSPRSSCCSSKTRNGGDDFDIDDEFDGDTDGGPCKIVKAICYIVYKPVGKARICKPTNTNGCK